MRVAEYMKLEERVFKGDELADEARWKLGRMLVEDLSIQRENGMLQKGKAEELIRAANDRGFSLSSGEITRRMQCARAYQTAEEFFAARQKMGSWYAMREAGFPTDNKNTSSVPFEQPHDPRSREQVKAGAKTLSRRLRKSKLYEQGWLPGMADEETTLRTVRKHIIDQLKIASRVHEDWGDAQREIDRLIAVMGGNDKATMGEALKKDASTKPENEAG